MEGKGRRIVLAVAALGAAAIGIAAFAARHRLAEEWWLRRLSSGDESVRLHAAGKLAGLKSLRAVPVLLDLIREDPRE